MYLLDRNKFRTSVFKRDNFKCIICGKEAKDAHHILERRLFADEGYYINNGVSLCTEHHVEAEMTILSCEELRRKANIQTVILPPHLYKDEIYDKWGNIILPNGNRLRGELFFDESVQKILRAGNMLCLFTYFVKYPRTYHLPWSASVTKDDRIMLSTKELEGKEIVILEKMDGESTTLYDNYIHARSTDPSHHISRSWVKNFHSKLAHNIPKGWRICGENLHYKKSIYYDKLPSFFLGFSIWDNNICLSWNETMEWFGLLDIKSVPVLYRGLYKDFSNESLINEDVNEGYIIRITDSFFIKDFKTCVGKYVRKNHIRTHEHWMRSNLIQNRLETK